MRRIPIAFEGVGTSLTLHCRYVFWKQHPQSFQHIHWSLQRQPQKGMTTLQVILLWSLLYPWEINKIKLSNLNKTVKPRGPVAYRLEWSYCCNSLSTYISLYIKLKWWEDVTTEEGFSCSFYTMHWLLTGACEVTMGSMRAGMHPYLVCVCRLYCGPESGLTRHRRDSHSRNVYLPNLSQPFSRLKAWR